MAWVTAHASPPVGVRQPREGTAEGLRDAAQGDPQHFRDLPIPESLGAQAEASSISFWKRLEDRAEASLALGLCETLFWIGTRIDPGRGQRLVPDPARLPDPRAAAVLQGQVVRDLKEPRRQVRPWPPAKQVSKQREKRLLQDILAFFQTEAERSHVSEQPVAISIEQGKDFLVDVRQGRRAFSVQGRRKRQRNRGIG
jgi:hypothetical protein